MKAGRFQICLGSVLLCLLMSGLTVLAQEKGHIQLQCVAETEIEVLDEDGNKQIKRVDAGRVIPGDTVIYTIKYKNISDDDADNVKIRNPVPEHMMYVDGSAQGEDTDIEFSVDGGKSFDKPGNLKVVDEEDGEERVALPSEYTTVRWTLTKSLEPGLEGTVSYRTILE